MQLGGARVLVTGGSRGIGRQFAYDLASLGARVGVCDVDADGLGEAKAAFEEEGLDLWTASANVADEADVERLFSGFSDAHGGIDAVVNNAGITRDGLLVRKKGDEVKKLSLEDWQKVIDVNLTGVFLCAREAALHMIDQETGGVIVSISSISRHGNMGQSNYSAAKAGVAALTVTWAKELARYGVRVAAIAPGYVSTEMTEALRDDVKEKIVAQIPLGRLAQPTEISRTLRYVLENEYVHGRVIEPDGGLRI